MYPAPLAGRAIRIPCTYMTYPKCIIGHSFKNKIYLPDTSSIRIGMYQGRTDVGYVSHADTLAILEHQWLHSL